MQLSSLIQRITLSGALIGIALQATAAVIDFETVPGVGVPTEGLAISNQFLASAGVSFSLEGGGTPRIGKVGSPRTAFQGFGGADDTPAPGQGIGEFFLTDDGLLGGLTSQALIVHYATPTSATSGVLLDIDFDEKWTIQARDGANNIVATLIITAGDAGTGNGIATHWSFDLPGADIHSIRFKGTRTASGAFGLGFDNFSPTQAASVPLPAAIWLLGSALGSCGLARRPINQRKITTLNHSNAV